MADFMRMKYENPKLEQTEMANQLSYSTSILQRYKNDIHICYHHTEFNRKTPINEQKRFQIAILTTTHIVTLTLEDLKRPQNDLKRTS